MGLDMALQESFAQRKAHGARYVPWAPLALGVVACVSIGIW